MEKINLKGKVVCIVDAERLERQNLSSQFAQHGITVLEASSGQDLFAILAHAKPDCILLEHSVGPESGLIIYAQLKERFLEVPPVVMLTNVRDQRTIIKAFRNGVSDYLLRDETRQQDVLLCLQSVISRRLSEESTRAETQALHRRSVFDELTGLYRREAVEDMISGLARSRRFKQEPFAVVLIELADYDVLENRFGQAIGKRLIKAFAENLKKTARQSDFCGVFRQACLAYIVDTSVTQKSIELLVARLAEQMPLDMQLETLSLRAPAFFGVAMFPEDGNNLDELVGFAEKCLASCAKADLKVSEAARDNHEPSIGRQDNRRAERRRRVFKTAKIIINAQHSVVDCTIRDLTEKGARLRVENIFAVPDSFDLLIVGSRATKRAVCRWQTGCDVGVEFDY